MPWERYRVCARDAAGTAQLLLWVPMLGCMQLAAPHHGHVHLWESVLGARAHAGRCWRGAACLILVVVKLQISGCGDVAGMM